MQFNPDHRFAPGESLAPLTSAAWWNGLLEMVRRGARLTADPATGLQIVPGPESLTIVQAGSHTVSWARAAAPIPAATGTNGEQMGTGTVRLWIADNDGLKTDTGIDADVFNGALAPVSADRWLLVQRVGGLWVVIWEDCPPEPEEEEE